MDRGMRADEVYVSGTAAVADLAATNGKPRAPAWNVESLWHVSAPRAACEAFAAGDQTVGWKAWRRHLHRRRRSTALDRLTRGKSSTLIWSADMAHSPRFAWLVEQLSGRRSGRGAARKELLALAQKWCEESPLLNEVHHSNGKPRSLTTHETRLNPCEGLAWLHLLVARTELFSCELWWQVFTHVLELARRPAVSLESDPLTHQVLAGELPLSLAALLPELNPCRVLRAPAAVALSNGMAELLDGEGLPQCRYLDVFHSLIACWSRCRLVGRHMEDGCWNEAAEAQFPLALREAVRLAPVSSGIRENPVPVDHGILTNSATKPSLVRRANAAIGQLAWLADVARDLNCDKPTRRLVCGVLDPRKKSRARPIQPGRLPSPAVHSEWAEIAVLRTDWSRRAAQLSVAYGEEAVRLKFTVGSDTFFAGRWELDVRIDGAPAAPAGSWREVCWASDDDCDYLELEIALTESLRVQRQMLLARRDQFLFLADAVLGERSRTLSYSGRLPLAGDLTTSAAAETCEMLLEARKSRALILPLALPEWRADLRGGALGVGGDGLELSHSCTGGRLFAPLWIDLAPRRADKPFTWRQLTIAEQRQNLPRDEAAGYRVQFGRRQWLIYRSLTEPTNRTLLGHNLSTDFLLARFGRDGETEKIVEIE
jgi:hypothetical protein